MPEMLGGLKQNLVCTETQRSHRERERPAFECFSVTYRGTGQQWPVMGTGALAAADLGGMAFGINPLGRAHH